MGHIRPLHYITQINVVLYHMKLLEDTLRNPDLIKKKILYKTYNKMIQYNEIQKHL